ncbi:MAG: acyltransferase [Flavobacteriales bacterium]|nr:acyltransferase [Flavobacteriales bacterium]
MSGSKNKIAILDIARGACALIVALYHFLYFSSPHGTLFELNNPVISTIGPYMPGIVCVFFLISGYVLFLHLERNHYALSDLPRFLLKRVIRLHVPLIACILLILSINTIFQLHAGLPIQISWSQLLANVTLSANFVGEAWYNPIFWTLAIEFQFYLFIGLLFPLIRKAPFPWLLALGVAALIANIYFDLQGTLVEFGSYFTIGIAMYLLHQKRMHWIELFLLVLIGITDFYLNQKVSYFLLSVLFIPIISFVSFRSKWLEFAGDISYSFYLIHGAVGGLFLYFTARHVDQLWLKIVLFVSAIFISYATAYVFYLLFEKTSARWGRYISYKRSA